MPSTTTYSRGEVLGVSIPFTPGRLSKCASVEKNLTRGLREAFGL